MNVYTFLSFFYGAVGGATACILFFFVVFRKIDKLLSDTVRKKARKHAEFDAVAKDAASVAPAKVETLCKIVRFDNSIVSEAIQCRMVFYGSTIDVYQVDELRTLPDHRQEVVAEHMLGRINRACVVASAQRISKYHRHRNHSTRYSAIKGKCTVLTHKDGMPLFLEDPTALMKERLRRLKEQQLRALMLARLRHRAERLGTSLTEEQLQEEVQRLEEEARRRSYRVNATAEITGHGVEHDLQGLNGAAKRNTGASRPFAVPLHSHRRTHRHAADEAPADDVPLSEWTCMAIKFPTRRVQERWLNLLQCTPQSLQWHDFITHLPQMDVLNLLIARLFFENSRANTLHDMLEDKLKKKLAHVSKSLPPTLKGNIYLDALDVGGEIPLISNVSDPSASHCGDTEFDFDVLYRGGFALKIRFSVLYREIRVPDIIFSIKVLELAGRMRFNVGPPPTRKFWLACPQTPELRLHFAQEVASHDGILNTVLKLLPDMSQVASNVVKVLLFEDMVIPNMDDFPWPVLGDDSDDEENTATAHSEPETVEDEHNISLTSLGDASPHNDDDAGGEHDGSGAGNGAATGRAGQHSRSSRSSNGSGDGKSEDTPRKVITVQAASSFNNVATSPAKRNVHFRSRTNEMPSPPPRPPSAPPRATQSSSEVGSVHSDLMRGGVPPAGLPPRPPRTASASFTRSPVQVPLTRAPGSSGLRSPSDSEKRAASTAAPRRHNGRMRLSSALAAAPAVDSDTASPLSAPPPPPPQDPPQSGSFSHPHVDAHADGQHHHDGAAAAAAHPNGGWPHVPHSARTSPSSAQRHGSHLSHMHSGSSPSASAAGPTAATAHQHSDLDSLSDDAPPARRSGPRGTPPPPLPLTAEDLNATVLALRHENRILRQRVEVLTSSRTLQPAGALHGEEDEKERAAGGTHAVEGSHHAPAMVSLAEAPRDALLARIACLEAAVRLEALERDVVEQRLLAQERVLRALCSCASPPPPLPT